MTARFLLRLAPSELAPPMVADINAQDAMPARFAMRDPEPVCIAHPLFVERTDIDWFCHRAWNRHPPILGAQQHRDIIRRDRDKFVVLHRLGEGVLFDANGAINSPGFLNNMKTLPEGMRREGDYHTVDTAALDRAPRLPGNWIVFYNGNLQNYYHWLIEAMLSLHVLDRQLALADRTLLPARLPADAGFDHLAVLRLLGHEHLHIERVDAPYAHLESVVYMEHGEVDHVPACVLRDFQSRVASRFGGPDAPQGGHRICVLRGVLRCVADQAALDAVLGPLGFRNYRLEEMSAEAQIRLFAQASIVVSPHGAGLSNLVFAPPGCKVVELMPDCEMRPFFWHIGAKLGHNYGMLPCPTHDNGFNGRLLVDVEKLRALLAMVRLQR